MIETIAERWFQLTKRRTTIRQELLAGLTTFSTMAYIIIVNPSILSQTGMDFGAVMVATALSAAISTALMGLYANYPFALAPGMGLNAYFTYGIVQGEGLSWQTALGAVFLSGSLFFILNLMRIRQLIAKAIPASLRIGVGAGMGLFLAFIGLKNVGIVTGHASTLVTAGSFTSPQALLTGFGLVAMTVFMRFRLAAAILLGILLNWSLGIALGLVSWKGVMAAPPSMAGTWMQLDVAGALDPRYLSIIFALLFVDLFDTTGTLVGIAQQGKFLDHRGRLPKTGRAMTADATGTMVGALCGTSTVTTYLESAAGVAAGGRTGLTALVVAVLFLLTLFFEPLVSSIPSFATAPGLLLIGGLLVKQLTLLDWEDPTEFIPAFFTAISIPLTFSVATGIGLGCIGYPIIKACTGQWRQIHWFGWVLAAAFALRFALL